MASDHSNVYVRSVPIHRVEGNCQMFNTNNSDRNVKCKDVNNHCDRVEHNVVDKFDLTHVFQVDYVKPDTSFGTERDMVSMSTVDILNSCFHDVSDNSINYLVYVYNNVHNMFSGFYFLSVNCLRVIWLCLIVYVNFQVLFGLFNHTTMYSVLYE